MRISIRQRRYQNDSAGSGSEETVGRRRRGFASLLLGLVMAISFAGTSLPGVAVAEEYDSTEAGHPLRIIGYVLHPVGVALDYLINPAGLGYVALPAWRHFQSLD